MDFDIVVGGNKVLVKKQIVYFFIKIKNCLCNKINLWINLI